MFDPDALIEDCRAALAEPQVGRHIREIAAEAVSDGAVVARALGPAKDGGINTIFRSDDLTIIDVHWRPGMVLMPHNHNMWAVIGIYCGREDNILWRRLPEEAGDRIEAAGAKSLSNGDALALGPEVIHSVINPIGEVTRAIHIYGGDFFAQQRSEWDPMALTERPLDLEQLMKRFAG